MSIGSHPYNFYLLAVVRLAHGFLILKKITNRQGLIIGLILFALLNFIMVENILWFETFIATLYLCIIYASLTISSSSKSNLLIGFLICLVSFIKPNAAVINKKKVVK